MRPFILALSLAGLATGQSGVDAADTHPRVAERPNIVFIMSDDHAAHAISAYGSHVNRTPNIDRLAKKGMLLSNVFATNSICTPSRAAILTGQYSHVNGVTVSNRFDSARLTVAQLLHQGGYYTGMIGKWHLGSDPVGFDRWEIFPGQGVYTSPILYTATGETTYTGRYATDVITDLALDFIKNRPRGKPFFLMLHHKAPHRPWDPDAAHRAPFVDRWIPEPSTLWDSYATRTDALHENEQRVAKDMTRRDLKLEPPPGLAGGGSSLRSRRVMSFATRCSFSCSASVRVAYESQSVDGSGIHRSTNGARCAASGSHGRCGALWCSIRKNGLPRGRFLMKSSARSVMTSVA